MMSVKKALFGSLLIVAILLTLSLNIVPLSAQGGVTSFSNVRVSNFFRAAPRTTITVTNGATITPTGSYQPLTAAGAVAASITARPAGSIVTLINIGSNTITFTETATLISAGNIALGAGDATTLYSDGTNYYQVGASNN
jgi:hypothetical protein